MSTAPAAPAPPMQSLSSPSVAHALACARDRVQRAVFIGGLLLLAAGCARGPHTTPTPAGVEAISLLGDTLRPSPRDSATRAQMERQLAEAQAALARAPENADSLIWVGRRLAYLGRHNDAIAVYTRGLALHPRDARFLRHRGHRYITTRRFDRAIDDLSRAVQMVDGMPDAVEPDGQPNARGVPIGTLHSNILYHLGLAHYLQGRFDRAAPVYEREVAAASNDDRRVSASYWLHMSLRRVGRHPEADRLLAAIPDSMDLAETETYHRLLRLARGDLSPDALLPPDAGTGTLENATAAYGVGAWHLYNGRTAEAERIFRRIVAGGQWESFGYIAAEAELARMRR